MKKKTKGWGWGALALLTCPCHLIIIIPLLAGTALGAFLTTYKTAAFIILGALFALSLYRVLNKIWPEKTEKQSMDCCIPNKKEAK